MSKSSEQYNKYAKDYDEFSRTAVPWAYLDKPTIEKEFIPLVKPNIHLLEVGCGGGKVMELLQNHKIKQEHMVGVDSSEGLLEIAQKHLPRSHFILSDISDADIPLSKDFFDAAISVRVLEYLTVSDLEKTMRNIFATLKTKGTFFIIVGHPLRVNNGDIAKYLERGWRSVSLPWGMKVDLYHKTISDYIDASVKAGFHISFVEETVLPDKLKKNNPKAYENYNSYGAINLVLLLQKI